MFWVAFYLAAFGQHASKFKREYSNQKNLAAWLLVEPGGK